MANATAITVRSMVRNGTQSFAANAFDTGTNPVTVVATVNNVDRVGLLIRNAASVAVVVSVSGDQHPPSYKSAPPALTASVGSGSVALLGPFSPNRFFDGGAGGLTVTLTPTTTAAISCTVTCFKVPKA